MSTPMLIMQPLALLADLYPPERHPVVAYLARLNTAVSRESMLRRLNISARILSGNRAEAMSFPWHHLTYVMVMALRSHLAETAAMQTTNTTLYAVRGVLRECWRLGYITADEMMRACDVPAVKGVRLPKGRALEASELEALLRSCYNDPRTAIGARDAALLALLYGLGLRTSEAIALEVSDYHAQDSTLRIRHGKGNKERMAYANGHIAQALNAWLRIRGDAPGPLLRAIAVHDTILPRRVVRRSINKILRERMRAAGVAKFSPHDLRRTFISNLLDTGTDLVTVQQLAGHAHIDTTALYDRRGERAKRAAMEKLRFV